jgi:hypothetical protein
MADYFKNIDYIENCTDEPLLYGVQYRVITDLLTEPVTVDFFKLHAHIDFDTDDNLIISYLKSARQELEQFSQMSFGVKTINLKALYLPKNYKLMYGYVNTITTTGYTNFGDILKEGGTDIDIEYTTYGILNETIKIAICRMAAGLYIFRENIVESKYNYKDEIDESRKMLKSISNITLF